MPKFLFVCLIVSFINQKFIVSMFYLFMFLFGCNNGDQDSIQRETPEAIFGSGESGSGVRARKTS